MSVTPHDPRPCVLYTSRWAETSPNNLNILERNLRILLLAGRGEKPLPLTALSSGKRRFECVVSEQGSDAGLHVSVYIVPYRGFYSRRKFIFVPKTQHTAAKYNHPFSKHTSGVYVQRCPTQDSFYRTSSGNLPTRTHILAVRKSPNTGSSLAISEY
jgi:hypothetical protein